MTTPKQRMRTGDGFEVGGVLRGVVLVLVLVDDAAVHGELHGVLRVLAHLLVQLLRRALAFLDDRVYVLVRDVGRLRASSVGFSVGCSENLDLTFACNQCVGWAHAT